jgi:hypothetical protein
MEDRNDRERYLEDVALIKQTLREQEDRLLIAPWAFYSWAAVIVGATVLSVMVGGRGGWNALETARLIWIPALCVGGILETAGWIQHFRRENRVLFTSTTIRLALSFVGVVATALVLVFSLLVRGVPVAGTILLLLAICFFVLAVFSFKHLFFEAYGTLVAGTILTVIEDGVTTGGIDSTTVYLVAGLFAALVFLVSGVHSRVLDRRASRRRSDREATSRGRHE